MEKDTATEVKTNYLYATIILQDLNTYQFGDPTFTNEDTVRISVGWRNPQENAYDVHNIQMKYLMNSEECEFKVFDGYAFGSMDSSWYQIK